MPDTCSRCGKGFKPDKLTPGYGSDAHGNKFCFDCCGILDREYMMTHDAITLYLDEKKRKVSNWPGTLKFKVEAMWRGDHNMGGKVTFVRFYGPDGKVWSGKTVGDMTQLCHCKRTKLTDINA